jgi:hypothetical protein
MTTSDGSISGTTLVIDHGPPARRWNLVILGDGYSQNDLGSLVIVAYTGSFLC